MPIVDIRPLLNRRQHSLSYAAYLMPRSQRDLYAFPDTSRPSSVTRIILCSDYQEGETPNGQ